jgi:hypothetical protein
MNSVVDNALQNEGKEDNKIQNEFQNNNNEIISPENLILQFKININKKVNINIQVFNLYQKIKNTNEISPLMI